MTAHDFVEALKRHGPCMVPHCRKACEILPKGAEVVRASGDCLCEQCGKPYYEHPTFAYPSLMGHCVQACDGRFLHL